jgi:hypothetical protein
LQINIIRAWVVITGQQHHRHPITGKSCDSHCRFQVFFHNKTPFGLPPIIFKEKFDNNRAKLFWGFAVCCYERFG